MWEILQELTGSVRFARRNLGAYVGLILTLGISVAATTTVLSVVYFVFLRDLPYRAPHSLVRIAKQDSQGYPEDTNYAQLLDWRARNTTFDALAAIRWQDATVLNGDNPERINAAAVTANLFRMLGAHALLGRVFESSDEQPGDDAAILTEQTWREMFGADRHIVGRRVRLTIRNATFDYRIVGVMPSNVRFYEAPPYLPPHASIFLAQHDPLAPEELDLGQVYVVFGRLKPSVSMAVARDDLTRLVKTAPSKFYSPGGYVVSMHEAELGRNGRWLGMLALTVGLVTLIASLNIAGLLLSVGSARRREFAVRAAIGATRARLVRQLLVEHGILVLTGTAIGAWLSTVSLRAVITLAPAQLPRIEDVRISWQVFAIGCGLAALTALLSGFLPVMLLSRGESFTIIKGTATTSRHGRWRDALVAAQLGLVVAVTLAATLAVRSFRLLEGVNLGYDPRHIVAAQLSLGPRWDASGRPAVFQRQLLTDLRNKPGVVGVALAHELPPTSRGGVVFLRDGRVVRPRANDVSADYFRVLRIPVLAGQSGGNGTAVSPVIANESFVHTFLSGPSSIGQPLGAYGQVVTGMVGNTWDRAQSTLTPAPMIYFDLFDPQSGGQTLFWVLVRTRSPENMAVATIRNAVNSIDPDVPLTFTTLDSEVARARVQPRFLAMLLGAFGGFGLLLAAVGVFTGVQQSVTERLRELAIRIALGAEPRRIRYLVVQRILALSSVAVITGGWTGLLGGRGLRTVLFGLVPNDLPTLLAAGVMVAAVAVAAAWRPLKHAVSVDPVVLLREE